MKTIIILSLLFLMLAGCAGSPPGIQVVRNFDINRYLGKWYEIARLDHSFERGLSNVSALYTSRGDGGIDVLNKGYDKRRGSWKQAKGRAYFVKDKTVGKLKVSFFRPFYGGYNVIDLDHENYSYAMVCGPDRSYFWILARERKLARPLLDRLLEKAKSLDFEVDKLIFVEQDRSDA